MISHPGKLDIHKAKVHEVRCLFCFCSTAKRIASIKVFILGTNLLQQAVLALWVERLVPSNDVHVGLWL